MFKRLADAAPPMDPYDPADDKAQDQKKTKAEKPKA